MKILITTDVFIKVDGVSTSVKNLFYGLIELGHDVRLLTLSGDSKNHKDNTFYYVKSAPLDMVYKGIRMPLSYNNEYIKEIIEWKPDVIHSQCEVFTYGYALKISKKTGAPIVHTYHTMYDDYVGYIIPFKRLGRWIIKKLTKVRLKEAGVLVVPTHKVENALLNYGLKNEIQVIPSGISLDQHKERISPQERLEVRRSMGIKDDEVVLITLGRLAPEKNVDEIVRFFASSNKTDDKLRYMIVGDGPSKCELENLVKELNLQDKIIFTGMVEPKEVHLFYQLGDIFVSSSTSETQGLTYVEAMANGLPLLCRYDDCLEGVLIEGENGYFYADGQAFDKGLSKLKDKMARKKAGKKSLEISSAYDKSQFGNALEQVYKKVLKKSDAK